MADNSLEQPSFYPETIPGLIDIMCTECFNNIDLYRDSPNGIRVTIGNTEKVDWDVNYRPPSGSTTESVTLIRNWGGQLHPPVMYTARKEGYVAKVTAVAMIDASTLVFERDREIIMGDPAEVDILRAIVVTAHKLKRRAKKTN